MDNIDFSVEDFTSEELICYIDIEKRDVSDLSLMEQGHE